MTIAFLTLGCKVNQVDSEAMRERMVRAGFVPAGLDECPDIIVINSCTVTAESERKTQQKLRHYRGRYPQCILVLTGCAVQVSPDADSAYPEADILLGHQDSNNLAHYIVEYALSRDKSTSVTPHYLGETFSDQNMEQNGSRTRANLKIEDGCNQFCSYCIIPHARGHVRSKPLDLICQDIKTLAAQGFQEVVLVGINLTAYGSDLGCDLCDAIMLFEKFSNVKRLRLGSLEPTGVTEDMLQKLSRCKSLCPHFHLSLQSGCDSVLKRMNRHYTTSEYFSAIKRIRYLFPDSSITADLIIGFPGESEEEFSASLAFAREIGFSKIHAFPFSARPGTSACNFAGQISKSKKQARMQKTLSLANELNQMFLIAQLGKTLEVLLEEPNADGMQGYAPNYAPITAKGVGPEMRNQIIPVYISEVKGEMCFGDALL